MLENKNINYIPKFTKKTDIEGLKYPFSMILSIFEENMIISEKHFIFPVLFLFFFFGSSCEHHCPAPEETFESTIKRTVEIRQNITAQGDGDAYLNSHTDLESVNGSGEFFNIAANWTRFGDPALYRSYFKIDLSEIKADEEIISAMLILHTKPPGLDGGVPSIINETVNPNTAQMCLVTDSWEMSTLTWINQPRFSELPKENLIFTVSEDYPPVMGLDITDLLKCVAGKSKRYDNNGFVFKMTPEADARPYRAFVFYSMNAEASKQPYIRVKLSSDQ